MTSGKPRGMFSIGSLGNGMGFERTDEVMAATAATLNRRSVYIFGAGIYIFDFQAGVSRWDGIVSNFEGVDRCANVYTY